MKKILMIGLILILLLMVGCMGRNTIFNLTYYTTPNDAEFLEIIDTLDTPEKICYYMTENFNYVINIPAYSPYEMWQLNIKAGDCNDYSTFAIFVANYHGYETYQILIYFTNFQHMLGVFVEEQKYNYSDCQVYYPIQANNFREIVEHQSKKRNMEIMRYIVYDYNMRVIEKGVK